MIKKISAVILAVAVLFSFTVFAADQSTEYETFGSYVFSMDGNRTASVTLREGLSIKAASTDARSTLTTEGNTVTVTGEEGFVGIATLSIDCGLSESLEIEIPLGYTTFIFNGDSLCVYEGADTDYSVSGVNAAAEEYTSLETEATEDGGIIYKNTDAYKLYIEIPKSGGTYAFSGIGNDMAISVKKGATAPATLLLASLTLSSSFTSPITVKKDSSSSVDIKVLSGHTNTLSDCEFNNADIYGATEDGGDGTNIDYAESAVIKAKSYSQLTLSGKGKLKLCCATKNAIKVGEYGSLTVDGPSLEIESAKHGISCDNTLSILDGVIKITAANDGIRTDPQSVDAALGCAGNISISGGTFIINCGYDCIQSAQDIDITGGIFNLTSGSGYNDSAFDSESMSCKGIKASFSSDESTDTTTAEATNRITVSGGIFNINTPDDAVHSDAYAYIANSIFSIKTGDDGVHADTTLILGDSGADNANTKIFVNSCYEGLEAGTVEIYSGTYHVFASDDGINAAGDSTSEFNPGGGWGGSNKPGHGGSQGSQSTSAYSISIFGGEIYVDAGGDGLDSNGTLNATGGNIVVFGAASGSADTPIDCDSTLTVNGAYVFAAGSSSMASTPTGQSYVRSTSSISSGKTVHINNSGTPVFSITTHKNLNYVLYSSPEITSSSSWSVTSDSTSADFTLEVICESGHSFEKCLVTEPMSCSADESAIFICPSCAEISYETIPSLGHAFSSQFTVDCEATETEEGSMSRHCLCCDATTDITSIPQTGEEGDTQGEIIIGDLDRNGTITAADMNLLIRLISGDNVAEAESENFTRADINGDGNINAVDSNLLLRMLVGAI